ncbi:MAG: response regulator transcription factor [Ignavibacterium sp.]|jgi:two-component system alkaline phosphatase synthesis response regulator PhoP
MHPTVLLVDDEKDILELLKYNLQKEGYRTLTAANGQQALSLAQSRPDLIVLDVMMPEMDGWEVCRALRNSPATAGIPVIFLTAKDDEVDEVVGLELGADDYIVKPVRVKTFMARVKKALRGRKQEANVSAGTIRFENVEIHPENYVVRLDGREVSFPRKEFEVLLFLARHPDRVIKRETLLNEIWGTDVYVVDRTVDVHIRKIREKLGKHAGLIETVKGVGYRLRKAQ